MPLGHASGDDAGDVNGRVLLLAAHHVEAQPFLRLRELHHPRVGVAFAGCEGCDCGLKDENERNTEENLEGTTSHTETIHSQNVLCTAG